MFDPSESALSRIGRWTFYILLFFGVAAYNADFDPAKILSSLGYALLPVIGLFGIQAIIVDPILSKLSDLEYKIDRLSGRKTPLD